MANKLFLFLLTSIPTATDLNDWSQDSIDPQPSTQMSHWLNQTVTDNNQTSEKEESITSFTMWLVQNASIYNEVLGWISISICAIGIVWNAMIVDRGTRSTDDTSGNKWMIYLASWDIVILIPRILLVLGQEVFGIDIRTLGNGWYRIFSYLSSSIALNASGHLVAMAIERAVNITFPTCHFGKT